MSNQHQQLHNLPLVTTPSVKPQQQPAIDEIENVRQAAELNQRSRTNATMKTTILLVTNAMEALEKKKTEIETAIAIATVNEEMREEKTAETNDEKIETEETTETGTASEDTTIETVSVVAMRGETTEISEVVVMLVAAMEASMAMEWDSVGREEEGMAGFEEEVGCTMVVRE